MRQFDVFNGDADGICALHQLRLDDPRPDALLITGTKRDVALLAQLEHVGDCSVVVLDISMEKNRTSLRKILAGGGSVFYIDHHHAGDLPVSERLIAHFDPSPLVCTSLIVNRLLKGKHVLWAIAGAFGDNLDESAGQLARQIELGPPAVEQLRETGILLNYNAYGATLDDLFFHPAELYRHVQSCRNPLELHADSPFLRILREGFRSDMDKALASRPLHQNADGRVLMLPSVSWARRVSGVYANALSHEQPNLAHALLIENSDGSLLVSVRAPLSTRIGADALCRQFPSGGGRAAAAGINALPAEQLDEFVQAFCAQFKQHPS